MAGKPPSLFGDWERGKKTTRGPDPRFVSEFATRDIKDLEDVQTKVDPVTGNRVPRENFAAIPINPGGTKSLINRVTGAKLSKEPVEFAVLDDEYVKIPTNTTDYGRPRTVAAAWDPARVTLTVVFRDSTFYNYSKVSREEWNEFKNHHSPGEYIRDKLDSKPRGPADVSVLVHTLGNDVLKEATELARKAQLREAQKQRVKPTGSTRRTQKPAGPPPSTGRGTYQPTTFNFGDL